MQQIFSTIKAGTPQLPTSGFGLYPSGLVALFYLGEAGGLGLTTGDAVTWDSLQQIPLDAVTGSIIGAPGWIQGRGGSALQFNGSGYLHGTKYTRAIDPLTWACWIKPNGANGRTIASKNDANTVSAGWYLNCSTTEMQLVCEHSTTNLIARTSNVPSDWTTAWHHVVVVWDGTTTAANVKIYIDGILRALTSTTNGVGTHGSDATFALELGRGTGGGSIGNSGLYDGALESLFMFKRQLSQTEANELMMASYRWIDVSEVAQTSVTFTQSLDATMGSFSATLTKQTSKNLDASMGSFAGVLSTLGTFFLSLDATMGAWSATLTKHTTHSFDAAMSTFSAVLAGAIPLKKAFNVAMSQFAALLTRRTGKTLSATMGSWAATLSAIFIPAGSQVTIDAVMDAFAGVLTKQTGKHLTASMNPFSATLTLVVTHGGVPTVCTPANCDNDPNLISHIEPCDNPGS